MENIPFLLLEELSLAAESEARAWWRSFTDAARHEILFLWMNARTRKTNKIKALPGYIRDVRVGLCAAPAGTTCRIPRT